MDETTITPAITPTIAESAAPETPVTVPETPVTVPETPETPAAPAPALSAASRALPKKPAAPKEPEPPTTATVVDVRFKSGGKVYYFDPGKLVLPAGAHVIIDTARGPEYGICTAGNHTVPLDSVVQPLRPVLRVATLQDERSLEENKAKEGQAFDICTKKIAEHGLEMKLVSVEYAFDGSKILFFFTADGRVDFRELVKDLASVFRTRIELRQIGVRDEAKMLGGLGICGRPFCCAQFLDDFQPVSIKMAKTQNLSLNPTKISGTCGRLMCCLKYEQEAYEDLLKTSPKSESFVDTPDGRGTVTDVNLLRQQVTVRMEDDPSTTKCYKNCDICVLRNGKAKKNDPPIPKDLAPISSAPKQTKETAAQEQDKFEVPEPMLINQFGESESAAAPRPARVPQSERQARNEQREQRADRQSSGRSRQNGNRQNNGGRRSSGNQEPQKAQPNQSRRQRAPKAADESAKPAEQKAQNGQNGTDPAQKGTGQRKKRSNYHRNYRRPRQNGTGGGSNGTGGSGQE
jgi:cell fate regulator YaaT (PSP1 superfamily)